jgi:hypothetical protein
VILEHVLEDEDEEDDNDEDDEESFSATAGVGSFIQRNDLFSLVYKIKKHQF